MYDRINRIFDKLETITDWEKFDSTKRVLTIDEMIKLWCLSLYVRRVEYIPHGFTDEDITRFEKLTDWACRWYCDTIQDLAPDGE